MIEEHTAMFRPDNKDLCFPKMLVSTNKSTQSYNPAVNSTFGLENKQQQTQSAQPAISNYNIPLK
jgi:hypothetical protein